MKRKIIKQGHNTLTVTLPSEFVKRFNLKAGKEIDFSEKDNGLFLTTEKVQDSKRIELDIRGMDIPTIWKFFMAVYREGYDEVKVKFDPNEKFPSPYKFFTQHRPDVKYYGKKTLEKSSVIETLQSFVSRFIGWEVVEHGTDFLIIKELGQVTSKEFDNSLRRIFLIVLQMVEETVEAVKAGNAKILIHMHDVDINLDKFHDYCVRVLNKVGNKDQKKTSLLFATLYLLELLGDEFKNLANHFLRDFPNCKMKVLTPFTEVIKKQINLYYQLFYHFDKSLILQMSEVDRKDYFLSAEMYKKASLYEREMFRHLKIMGRYLNALMELRIEMEF